MTPTVKTRGTEALARKLAGLLKDSAFEAGLDEAAAAAVGAADARLRGGGAPDIAARLEIAAPAPMQRAVSTDHPRARHAEFGTRRRPALGWAEAAGRAGRTALVAGVRRFLRAALRGRTG
jgi:hypothetical protein